MGAIAMAAPLGTQIRERILESAAALMEERSFFDISLADIARAARISKGTLYYYYNSRDAILFDLTDRYLQKLSDDLLVWVDNEEKDTSLPRLLRYTFSRGVYDKSGSMRLFLIAEAVSGKGDVRDKLLEKYAHFKNVLAQKIAARKPGADGEYLAWLTLTVMDGMLVQSQLKNPALDTDAFIEATARLITEC